MYFGRFSKQNKIEKEMKYKYYVASTITKEPFN